MVNLNNIPNLVGVLTLLCDDNPNTVQKAEKALKPFLKNSGCAIPLMQVLCSGFDDAVREKAASLLRKKIASFYHGFSQEHQNQLKAQLLSQLLSEQSKALATAVIGIIGAVADAIYSEYQEWTELFQFLLQLIGQDPDEKHRALGFALLSLLILSIREEVFIQNIVFFERLFNAGCKDISPSVNKASLNALIVFIGTIGDADEIMALNQIFYPVFNILAKAMKEEDEDTLLAGFNLFRTCCELEQPLINDHLEPVSNFSLVIVLESDLDPSIKDAAGAVFLDVVRFRPKVFAKKKLVAPVVAMFMDRIAKEDSSVNAYYFKIQVTDKNEDNLEAEVKKEDSDKEDKVVSDVQKLIQNTIDLMATWISSKHFLPAVLGLINNSFTSPDPRKRKASCVVLGNVAEGCNEQLRLQLDTLLPKLCQLLNDESVHVRDAAFFTLGRFVRHCEPEIFLHSDKILPILLKGLEDPYLVILGGSLFTLEIYCESVPCDHVIPYLQQFVDRFDHLFSKGFKSRVVKETAIGALSELLGLVQSSFEPYIERTMNLMLPLISVNDPDEYGIRGQALNCIGTILLTFGEEKFSQSHYEIAVKSAMENFELDNVQLRSHSFIFVANVLKAVGKKFEPYIPQLVCYATAIIAEKEYVRRGGQDGGEGNNDVDDDDEDDDNNDDEDDEEEEEEKLQLSYHTDLIDQKVAAIKALASIPENTQSLFQPYLNDCFSLLAHSDSGALRSQRAEIRSEAITALGQFIEAVSIESPESGVKLNLSAEAVHLTESILRQCFRMIAEDSFQDPVSRAFEVVDQILTRLGRAALDIFVYGFAGQLTVKDVVLSQVLVYLSEQAPCQLKAEADEAEGEGEGGGEEEEEEEDGDHTELLDSVATVIGTLARLEGKDFVNSFNRIHPKLIKFTKPSRTYLDHNMAISCYIDVFEEIGTESSQYAEELLPVIQVSLTHSAPYVRHNAAYCVGLLIEYSGDLLVPHYLDILKRLYPICVRGKNEVEESIGTADVDNALSAVAKMILIAPEKVPLPHVLPVLLGALPLTDSHESMAVFEAILKLLEMNEVTIMSMVSEVVKVLGDNFHPKSKVPDETRATAAKALLLLRENPEHRSLVESYIASVSDGEQREAIEKSLQPI